MKMSNIALLSPSYKAYSETFIQAHKERLNGRIFYYSSGELPTKLENNILLNSRKSRIWDIVLGHFRLNKFSLKEKALIRSFKENKIEVILAEYGTTGHKILPVSKELNLPLIVHFHGADANHYDVLEVTKNYRDVISYATFIVVVSREMHEKFISLGCPKNKLVYNVYGPREEFFNLKPRFNKPQFVAIGRFVDKKAPHYLVLSFKEVVKEFPEAKLVIAGDGKLFNVCKDLVSFYQLENNIDLVGVITPQEYQDYLKESLAFVQHSVRALDGDAEGTPVSILEASAAGLPVLSTYHAGIPDVVKNNVSGLLVKEHDVQGMSRNMLYILNNPDEAKRMGSEGKKNLKENYTLERHIENLNIIIKKAIQTKKK